jgi:hypothetical protein
VWGKAWGRTIPCLVCLLMGSSSSGMAGWRLLVCVLSCSAAVWMHGQVLCGRVWHECTGAAAVWQNDLPLLMGGRGSWPAGGELYRAQQHLLTLCVLMNLQTPHVSQRRAHILLICAPWRPHPGLQWSHAAPRCSCVGGRCTSAACQVMVQLCWWRRNCPGLHPAARRRMCMVCCMHGSSQWQQQQRQAACTGPCYGAGMQVVGNIPTGNVVATTATSAQCAQPVRCTKWRGCDSHGMHARPAGWPAQPCNHWRKPREVYVHLRSLPRPGLPDGMHMPHCCCSAPQAVVAVGAELV